MKKPSGVITYVEPEVVKDTSMSTIVPDELMEGIGQEARSQLYEYNSQNLANSVRGERRAGIAAWIALLQLSWLPS